MDPVERHNRLAPEAVRLIVQGTLGKGGTVPNMLTVLESVLIGVVELAARVHPGDKARARSEYLDAVVQGATERLAAMVAERRA